jgi:hypothetical protein
MAEPRRNEKRFYTYPMNQVVAIIDDATSLKEALRRLEASGVDLSTVHVLTGPEGERLLDPEGIQHGWWARLLRFAQRGAFEGKAMQVHGQALANGHHVLFVPTRGDAQTRQVIGAVQGAGGHHLLHFRRWSIEHILTPPASGRPT